MVSWCRLQWDIQILNMWTFRKLMTPADSDQHLASSQFRPWTSAKLLTAWDVKQNTNILPQRSDSYQWLAKNVTGFYRVVCQYFVVRRIRTQEVSKQSTRRWQKKRQRLYQWPVFVSANWRRPVPSRAILVFPWYADNWLMSRNVDGIRRPVWNVTKVSLMLATCRKLTMRSVVTGYISTSVTSTKRWTH